MSKVDSKALELVEEDLDRGADLTFEHIGSVFGQAFWILVVEALLDSQDAARAIQGAIARLRMIDPEAGDDEFDDTDEDDDE